MDDMMIAPINIKSEVRKMSQNEKKGSRRKAYSPKKSGPALAVLPDRRRRPCKQNIFKIPTLSRVMEGRKGRGSEIS